MASKTIIEAAGGIVVRKGAGGLIAVVQRSKDDAWVLPRGKLKRDENPVVGARREVVEETGHRVEVHEFLGAITYRAGGRPKVVQFWRMEAEREASHELMKDIVAVEWLPLKAAVRRLSYPLEKLFLRHAAARALKKRRAEAKSAKTKLKKTKKVKAAKTKTKTKSRPVKVAPSAKKSVRKPAKLLLKQPKNSKAGKEKKGGKNSSKNKSGKAKQKKNKAGKPKKGKGRKAGREHPARMISVAERTEPKTSHAAQPAVERHAPASGVSALPKRSGPQDGADARKTILQRMLGRLAG